MTVMLALLQGAIPTTPMELIRESTLTTQIVLGVLAVLSLVSWAVIFGTWARLVIANSRAQKFAIEFDKTKRLDDQITWYRTKAKEHSDAMQVGRVLALALGVAAVVLSTVTGATTDTQTIWGAVLGIVTMVGASVGAYFQAGHFEAIALKYRETAVALENLRAEIDTAIANPADLVSTAETIMQAENAAWLTEVTAVPAA